MNWITEKILQYLCWRTAFVRAHCMGCQRWTSCGNIPDIGFMCDSCMKASGYLPERKSEW